MTKAIPFPDVAAAMADVEKEVRRAEGRFAPLNSAHEAYGILTEEYRELEAHVFTNEKRRDVPAMRQEAVQVAAMAIRFIRDVCDGRNGKSPNEATMAPSAAAPHTRQFWQRQHVATWGKSKDLEDG